MARRAPSAVSLTEVARRTSPPISALFATRRRQTLFALLLFGGFAIYLTWPLITDPGSTIYLSPARPRGDYTSIIAHLRELVEDWHNPFAPGRLEDFNAPHGTPIVWVLNVASFSSTLVLYPLAVVFGATAAVAIFVIGGFTASAVAMFLLVRRLTGSFPAALVIGFAYGFYPYVVANGEHPHFIHGWVFVLMAWRMIELYERPTIRNGVWAGLASLVAIGWTAYFVLLGGVLLATLAGASLVMAAFQRRLRSLLVPELVCLGIVLVFFGLVRALTAADSDAAAIGQASLADLYAQTARPPNFLVPNGNNPVLGDLTRPYLEQRGWFNATEKTLYVGISLCLLALVGGIAALRRRLPGNAGPVMLIFAAVAVVGLLFSAPPKVAFAGTEIPFPPYFVWKLQSGWRIYERFVIIVMLGLCVAAAFGVQALIQGRARRVRAAILAAVAIVVPLDLWSKYEPNTRKLEHPGVYSTLRELPPGIVAEYPIEPVEFGLDYDELYNQQYHDKPLLNGYPPRSEDEADALSLSRLRDSRTPGALAARGVRYVLLKHDKFNPLAPDPGGPPKRGLQLIRRSKFADLYLVTAPATSLFEPVTGVGGPEGDPLAPSRWALETPAVLALEAPCDNCAGQFRARLVSFNGRPRTVTIRQGGRVLARRTVRDRTSISVPLRFRRKTEITFEFTPGPQRVMEAVPGSADPRALGIAVEAPRFVPRG